MPDVDPQIGIDVHALPGDTFTGAPADPDAFETAKAAFYQELLAQVPGVPTCLPDHGVHIYLDHRGRGPCLCKSKPIHDKGVR